MVCFFCGGSAHPSTGCEWSERVIACGACTREFWKWLRAMQHRRWGGVAFYDAAVKFRRSDGLEPASPD
jgi:hypothetical protein